MWNRLIESKTITSKISLPLDQAVLLLKSSREIDDLEFRRVQVENDRLREFYILAPGLIEMTLIFEAIDEYTIVRSKGRQNKYSRRFLFIHISGFTIFMSCGFVSKLSGNAPSARWEVILVTLVGALAIYALILQKFYRVRREVVMRPHLILGGEIIED